MADTDRAGLGLERGSRLFDGERPSQRDDTDGCGTGGMADASSIHLAASPMEGRRGLVEAESGLPQYRSAWSDIQWIICTDGKARPTQPGIFPLAHGVSGRVGKLRAYGNAIVPQVAAEFIKSVMG